MTDKIYIGIDDKKIEAKGADLEYITTAQSEAQKAQRLFETEQLAKEEARKSAMDKLKKLGLTDEEIAALVP